MKQRFRWLFVLLAVCMVITMLPVQALAAQQTFTDKYGTWTYQEEADGSITIVSFQSARKNIVVPRSIGGKPVRKLGDGLFRDRNDLASIVIPYGVTTIGKDVFSGCEKLEKVTLPQSLKTIGDKAFSNCASLRQVFLPASITEFGKDLFIASPKVEVRCDINAPAAEYLKNNSQNIHKITLIDIKHSTTSASTNADKSTVQGKLVSYQFGQNINGKREFTVILIDTMPDLDLMQFVKVTTDSDGFTHADLDFHVYDLMNQRFHLVSLTRWDGKDFADIPYMPEALISTVSIDSVKDDDNRIYEVTYTVHMNSNLESLTEHIPVRLNFSASNDLLAYHFDKWSGNDSTVKIDNKTYIHYSTDAFTDEKHYANGELVWKDNFKNAYAHRIAIGGTCVNASIEYNSHSDSKHLTKQVTAKNPDRTSTSVVITEGINPESDSFAHTKNLSIFTNYADKRLSEASKSVTYQNDNKVASTYCRLSVPTKDHTYRLVTANYRKAYEWSNSPPSAEEYCDEIRHYTNNESVRYRDVVVRSDTFDEADDAVYGTHGSQKPDVYKNYVTLKNYESTPDWRTETTITDQTTGQQETYTDEHQSLSMMHHTYIGESGKFMGWDWNWSTSRSTNGDDPSRVNTRKEYEVCEYQYDSTTDLWVKTQVTVTAKNTDTANLDDFKTQYFAGDLDNYTITTSKWQFDSSAASSGDSWRKLFSEEDADSETAVAILKGESTVTDENGNEIKQSDAKKEMLDIGKDMETSLKKDDLEQIFDDTVNEIPGGADVLNKAQDLFNTQTPPESNTDDQIDHIHNDDGSVTTTITPAESASQAEETQEEAPKAEEIVVEETASEEAAAETPKAEEAAADAPKAEETKTEAPKADVPAAGVMEPENN